MLCARVLCVLVLPRVGFHAFAFASVVFRSGLLRSSMFFSY